MRRYYDKRGKGYDGDRGGSLYGFRANADSDATIGGGGYVHRREGREDVQDRNCRGADLDYFNDVMGEAISDKSDAFSVCCVADN